MIEELWFRSGSDHCAAWLHLPRGGGPHPFVVMLHSTAGVRQLSCYADRGEAFAEAGVAALQFDCRGFGASGGEPRQLMDVRRQAEDLAAALEEARRRGDLDPERGALWGASASCGPVLELASRDAAIAAVVCLTPFVPGLETQRSAGTPIVRLAAASLADRARVALRREPRGVAVGGIRGETAILVREDAAAGERSMLPDGAKPDPGGQRATLPGGAVWENRVVVRPRLRTPSPRRLAARVGAPLLVVAGDRDALCPPGPAAALADRAPEGELALLPEGHFELYRGAAVPAEARFLRDRLGA
jgi:fermentation-respiration switch protein FrsA (DUF1100 family)